METTWELWDKTLQALMLSLPESEYGAYIKDLKPREFKRTDGVLVLVAPESEFTIAQILLKYAKTIESTAAEFFRQPISIKFEQGGATSGISAPPEEGKLPHFTGENSFNPRFTFDNFIMGDNSSFAAGAARAVAEAPGAAYSPLFIYGGSGLGKTHLMNAIGLYVLEHFPQKKVLYVSSETFTEEFVSANLQKKMNEFKLKYRNVDVLLIDDIQFINEKEKTIEEVFNTFNALYNMNKQMVFTSDRPPQDILGIDERLRGRLAQGLLVDLQPPAYETKMAILLNKAKLDGIPETEGLLEAVSFIAEIVKTNVRDLESAFNRVVGFAKISGTPITRALAKQSLKDIIKNIGNDGITPKNIKKVVGDHFGVTTAQIDSEERTRTLAVPRQVAMFLCRELTPLSFPAIAKAFGKDYSTVHHGYEKIRKEITINEQLASIVDSVKLTLENEY